MVDILEITSPRPSPKERGKYHFGELDGGDEPTKHGFATAEYDGESSCFAMGMRMYSAEFGRFLSVDPLFEAMPRHTPYHYSFNSPLVWKDPSGLIPENEKDRDKLMERFSDDDLRFAYETYYETVEELQQKRFEADNFFIATRSQLEWMVMQTDYLSNGYESSMIDGTLNVLYGRTGGSGSGVNGDNTISLSNNSQIIFKGYTDDDIKKLETIINSSEDLKKFWSEIFSYLNENNQVSIKIGKVKGGASEVWERGSTIHLNISMDMLDKGDVNVIGNLAAMVQHLAHETAHVLGYLNGERIQKGQLVTLPGGQKLEAEEVRAQQIGNKALQNFVNSKGIDPSTISQGAYGYRDRLSSYMFHGVETPGSIDFRGYKKYEDFNKKYFKGRKP
jgi:RHS repeat-associated protein